VANPVIVSTAASSGLEARQALRVRHKVRLVTPEEEGFGIDRLPDGVFGFTYSPAIAAPLFATHRYRTFEMHRVAGGEALILGFVPAATADRLRSAHEPVDVALFHDVTGDSDTLIAVPYSRIIHHRQIATPNQVSVPLRIAPVE
jgi:hypothetical protein